MRIFNRAHFGWFVFVSLATLFAGWVFVGNFHSDLLPVSARVPEGLRQPLSERQTIGGTRIGLIFGATSFGIFVFAALLGVRKKIVLLRIGNVQRWLRAHIWLTLLTIPLVLFHCGFRLGGPMTTLLMLLYGVVMVSGVYGLVLQHHLPRLMKERLPAETVFEQIPHIRAQLYTAAEKMQTSFKPTLSEKPDAGAPASSAAKTVTAGSAPMASTAANLSTPTARAKSTVGSTVSAETLSTPAAIATASTETQAATAVADATVSGSAEPVAGVGDPGPRSATAATATPPETMGTPTARVPEGSPVPPGTEPASVPVPTPHPTPAPQTQATQAAPAKPKPPAVASDPESEAALHALLTEQILPYLAAKRGDKLRLGKSRYSDDLFRFVKLRVSEAYRVRVEEIQAWCDERRMLDLQTKLHHWMHGWLFIHVPLSFVLLMMTAWHAFVTLFYY